MIEQDDCDQKGGKKRRRGPKADQLSSSDPEILKAKNICEMAVTESVDDLLFAVSSNEAVCCRLKKAAMKKILVNAKANDGSSAAPPKETVNGISKVVTTVSLDAFGSFDSFIVFQAVMSMSSILNPTTLTPTP